MYAFWLACPSLDKKTPLWWCFSMQGRSYQIQELGSAYWSVCQSSLAVSSHCQCGQLVWKIWLGVPWSDRHSQTFRVIPWVGLGWGATSATLHFIGEKLQLWTCSPSGWKTDQWVYSRLPDPQALSRWPMQSDQPRGLLYVHVSSSVSAVPGPFTTRNVRKLRSLHHRHSTVVAVKKVGSLVQ